MTGGEERNDSEIVRQEQMLEFQNRVEHLAQHGDLGYIEAVGAVCDEEGIEIESVNNMISTPLRAKIDEEARSLNLVKESDSGRHSKRRRRPATEIKLPI